MSVCALHAEWKRRMLRAVGGWVLAGAASLAIAAPAAASPRISVSTVRQFRLAVTRLADSGGTIVLRRDHRFGPLEVGPRSRHRLTILGRGASTAVLDLEGTQAVHVRSLRITPRATPALATIAGSRHIRLTNIHAKGTTALAGAVAVIDSRGVIIEQSQLSLCGDRRHGIGGYCLRLRHDTHVTVRDNRFHDCFGCDFIHGSDDHRLLVTRNSFRRALVGPCGRDIKRCNHQDLIQIQSGSAFRFTRNTFGVYDFGAAQLYLTDRILGVTIQNNLFEMTDANAPGSHANDAIKLGNQTTTNQPLHAVVSENTILSGARRPDGVDNSIILSTPYKGLPPRVRPVIANNVIAETNTPERLCGLGRLTHNVVESGTLCSAADTLGDPRLDADARPTAASALVIDQGLPQYAPVTDFTGATRDAQPDIGAFEYFAP